MMMLPGPMTLPARSRRTLRIAVFSALLAAIPVAGLTAGTSLGGADPVQVQRADSASTMVARTPEFIPMNTPDAAALLDLTAAQYRDLIEALVEDGVRAASPNSGRWQVMQFGGLSFWHGQLSPAERESLQASHGAEWASRYDTRIATLLEDVVKQIDRQLPHASFSVQGLPIESGRGQTTTLRQANDRLSSVIDQLDALTSTRTVIRLGSGTSSGDALARLPETRRLRDGRPVLLRLNRVWQIVQPDKNSRSAQAIAATPESAAPTVVQGRSVLTGSITAPASAGLVAITPPRSRRVGQRAFAAPASGQPAAPQNGDALAPDLNKAVSTDHLARPDEVFVDCNNNGFNDTLDIARGTSADCNNDSVPDECQTLPDRDNDGTPDCADGCPNDPYKTQPGACGCGEVDTDRDGDGWPDCSDGCPDDPNKQEPGACGCGKRDADRDGDGSPDCVDGCPKDPNKTDPGSCGCGEVDVVGCFDGAELVPGSGFGGETPAPGPVGDSSDPGYDARAIGRWDAVPFQTIPGDFEIGVTAFHMSGIDRVEISIENGPWTSIETMTVNPRTGVREYWGQFSALDLPDGPVELRAVAYPVAGIPFVLPSMHFFTNGQGSLNTAQLHVSPFGNDASGNGSLAAPYLTIQRALTKARSDLATYDGAEIILLQPGEYDIDSPQSVDNERWITIRAADGLDRDTVIVAAGEWAIVRPKTRRLRFERISLDLTRTMQMYKEDIHWQWYDDCKWFQSAGWTSAISPFLQPVRNVGYNGLYITDSLAHDTLYGFIGCNFVRGSRVEKISGDCYQNSLVIIGCAADQVDGTIVNHHSDLLQYFGHFEQLVVYGLKATNITMTQNFFLDWHDTSFTDCAFVNIVIQNLEGDPPFSQLHSAQKHVLFSHVSNPGQLWLFRDDIGPPNMFVGDDVVFSNCVIDRMSRGTWGVPGVPEGVSVSHCHFLNGELHGDSPTTGPVSVEDGPAWTFTLTGAGVPDLLHSGILIPGLLTGDGDPSLTDPDRSPWPAMASVPGGY